MALAQSLTSGSTIHAVDLDSKALGTIPDEDHGVVIRKVLADLRSPGLRLPSVDGILMANSLHFIQDQHLFIKKLLPLTNSFLNCGVRTIKPKSLGTLSGRLRKAPRSLQRIRSAVGRETVDAAITVWRHDLLSLCSATLVGVVYPFTTENSV